jgi:hypothetical protein
MLSFRIYYRDCLFGGGKKEQLCEIPCQAIYYHFSHSFSHFVDSGHWFFGLDIEPNPMASSDDQSPSRAEVFTAHCGKNGRKKNKSVISNSRKNHNLTAYLLKKAETIPSLSMGEGEGGGDKSSNKQ